VLSDLGELEGVDGGGKGVRTTSWTRWENMWSVGGCPKCPVVASSAGDLYSFHKQQLMKYECDKNI